MRLSTRIALAVGATVPILVLATGWLLLRLVAADLHDQQDTHLRQSAAAVAKDARGLLRASAADRSAAVEQARERRLFTSALDVGVRLTGPGGTFMGGPQPEQGVSLPASAPVPVTLRADGDSWRVLSTRVSGGRPGVRGTLWLFAPDTSADTQLRLVRRRVVSVALLAAPLSGLLAGAVAGRASRPLRRLRDSASGLDPRTSTARLDHTPARIAEVDDLAHTLQTVLSRYDEQAARTGEALATARSFASAAAHELRTPLMSMQTNLEILTGHPGLPAPDRDEVLEDLRREHARLLGLLVMLRELGRGDLVEADAFGPVDLADVVEASVREQRRRHPLARIVGDCPPGLRVYGWEPGLRTVLDNLVINALVHGGCTDGRPAHIGVTVRASGDHALLFVDDQGPGIAPERRGEVFGRFERRPDSPGSGLGLTLVAQQIDLHRGRIRVLDAPGGTGTRIEVVLPLMDGGAGTEATLPLQRNWMITTARALPQEFHKEDS
ncbi:sensor histidine kinase [Streptomyces rhizosphaerihabitans]|uniref:sensor histidine kinase n=1 Tax=Streptomyces rhizosphaerihabitans TaxID=1266770 RepID=UPI0021BE5EF5|nr:HAMP domain-containing sensor histidine kinase [Streptomyces rhizosphaerihabitans]MCT9007898.1 HAMP domain-containing histidine kinase [Streptomyces rhizosphaerihabitans]